MAANQKRWNLFLPPELLTELREFAAKRDVPVAEVVRTACEKYLAAVKKAQAQAAETSSAA